MGFEVGEICVQALYLLAACLLEDYLISFYASISSFENQGQ